MSLKPNKSVRDGKRLPNDLSCCVFGIVGHHETVDAFIEEARRYEAEGAHGVCLELPNLREEFWNTESFRAIVSSVGIKTYVSFYRNDRMRELPDGERAEYLRQAAEAGADIVDIMGDFFNPAPGELSVDAESVAKQKALVRDLKARGARVLMSSHVLKFQPLGEVARIFKAQEDRGADIAKAVFRADTPEELNESLKTGFYLRDHMRIPFVHLCSGELGRKVQRYQTLLMGGALSFVRHEEGDSQPGVDQLLGFIKTIEK